MQYNQSIRLGYVGADLMISEGSPASMLLTESLDDGSKSRLQGLTRAGCKGLLDSTRNMGVIVTVIFIHARPKSSVLHAAFTRLFVNKLTLWLGPSASASFTLLVQLLFSDSTSFFFAKNGLKCM